MAEKGGLDLGKLNGLEELFEWFKEEIKDQIKVSTMAFFDSYDQEYDSSKKYAIAKVKPFPLKQGEEEYHIDAYVFGNISFNKGDKVFVAFTDYNFIKNLSYEEPKVTNTDNKHKNMFAVLLPANASGGTTDYEDLENLPTINNVELAGNKTTSDLGIDIPTKTSDLNNDSGFITNSALHPTLVDTVVSANNKFTFTIASSYNGVYTFTFGNCVNNIILFNNISGTTYKQPMSFVYDGQGSVVTTTMNYRVTGTILEIWSGNSNYSIVNGFTGYLFRIPLY